MAHAEAGLRSFNRRMPEELNRVLTDHVSTLLFCPTQTAVDNLLAEGITEGVELVGDVMYDCMRFYGDRVQALTPSVLRQHGLTSGSYYLATVHRAENTDDPECMANVVQALDELATPECPVVIPLHPRTRAKLAAYGLSFAPDVHVLDPVSYLEMLALERNARVIITDSGGVQKEAYLYRVPCVTLREETEWVETVEAGWNTLCAPSKRVVVRVASLTSSPHAPPVNATGMPRASDEIVRRLAESYAVPTGLVE
jgi:UDP-GlcNAc3NAcA epimerase